MEPAYQIALNAEELALLGEITVILGQVDEIMIQAVKRLLNVDREAANAIMGSSKIGDNSNIWANCIRNRCDDEDVLWLVEHANKEIQAVSTNRNDFIHAVFTPRVVLKAGPAFDPKAFQAGAFQTFEIFNRLSPTARRVRGKQQRSVAELTAVRDQASRLSCLVAHSGILSMGISADTSPWLDRLAPSLPPRLGTVATRKAKAQPTPRAPSQVSTRQRRREQKARETPKPKG